jgi:hypothetical protein
LKLTIICGEQGHQDLERIQPNSLKMSMYCSAAAFICLGAEMMCDLPSCTLYSLIAAFFALGKLITIFSFGNRFVLEQRLKAQNIPTAKVSALILHSLPTTAP